MVTSEDAAAQTTRVSADPCCATFYVLANSLAQFLEIWSEDGVAAEPEDDMIMG